MKTFNLIEQNLTHPPLQAGVLPFCRYPLRGTTNVISKGKMKLETLCYRDEAVSKEEIIIICPPPPP